MALAAAFAPRKPEVVHCRRSHAQFAYIGRPSVFGNPFVIGKDGDRDEVIAKFREYFYKRIEEDPEFREKVEGLRGMNLGCFCAPYPCHGDVYLEYLGAVG